MSWSSVMEVHSKSFNQIGIFMLFWGKIFHQSSLDDFFNGILDLFILRQTLEYGVFSTLESSRAQDSRRDEARLFAPSRPRPRAA